MYGAGGGGGENDDMHERTRLCATVTAATTAELRERRDAVREADMVELRLDTVRDPDVAGALAGRTKPVVVTCRPPSQGGLFRGSEEERRRILQAAAASDAEFVDLEWQSGLEDLIAMRRGRGVVLSHHDFGQVPANLEGLAADMLHVGARIVKIAVAIDRPSACARLLDLSRRCDPGRCVLIGMGDGGLVTRVLAARFGSPWSYAGDGVAPGQISVEAMHREFAFRRLSAATRLYGLLGRPIAHSVSPAMHNAGFTDLGEDAVYLPLPVTDMDEFARFADAFAVGGVSVTIPFKADVLRVAREVTAVATRAKAANTLTRMDGGYAADNTDYEGFLAPLADVSLEGRRAAVLGHGGAARTAALALTARGAHVTLYGRDERRTVADAETVGAVGRARPVPPSSWDVLVNATPVGTFPAVETTACPEAVFEGGLVYDLVYNPAETALLRAARQAGSRAIGGLDMLVEQARLQQLRWCGRRPSARALRDAALWKLSTFAGGV